MTERDRADDSFCVNILQTKATFNFLFKNSKNDKKFQKNLKKFLKKFQKNFQIATEL